MDSWVGTMLLYACYIMALKNFRLMKMENLISGDFLTPMEFFFNFFYIICYWIHNEFWRSFPYFLPIFPVDGMYLLIIKIGVAYFRAFGGYASIYQNKWLKIHMEGTLIFILLDVILNSLVVLFSKLCFVCILYT